VTFRPDRIGAGTVSDPTANRWYNVADFPVVPAGAYRFGNSGRNILSGPGTTLINGSVSKRFRFGGTRALQLRLEAFNLPNVVNLGLPENNVDLPTAAPSGARRACAPCRLGFASSSDMDAQAVSRRDWLKLLSAAAGTALLPGSAFGRGAPPAEAPNILLILADDMGFSDIGCFGSEIPTPNLDRLARGGLRFTQFHNTARCCPTRASLLTGLYPHQAGIGHMVDDRGFPAYQGHLNNTCVTIAEVLRPAGYTTSCPASGTWARIARTGRPTADSITTSASSAAPAATSSSTRARRWPSTTSPSPRRRRAST